MVPDCVGTEFAEIVVLCVAAHRGAVFECVICSLSERPRARENRNRPVTSKGNESCFTQSQWYF
jgi:hypothetical protein